MGVYTGVYTVSCMVAYTGVYTESCMGVYTGVYPGGYTGGYTVSVCTAREPVRVCVLIRIR